MSRLFLLLPAALSLLLGVPAWSVGLGPLAKEGIIDGPQEAFFLTLLNPYDRAVDFVAYPIGPDDDTPQDRVTILPADVRLGAGRTRQLLVVADKLTVGETYHFRVCAERKMPDQGVSIHARVCSKIRAHRIA